MTIKLCFFPRVTFREHQFFRMHTYKHKELDKYEKLFKVRSPFWEIIAPINIPENPQIPLLRKTNLTDDGTCHRSTEIVIYDHTKIRAACKQSFRNYK